MTAPISPTAALEQLNAAMKHAEIVTAHELGATRKRAEDLEHDLAAALVTRADAKRDVAEAWAAVQEAASRAGIQLHGATLADAVRLLEVERLSTERKLVDATEQIAKAKKHAEQLAAELRIRTTERNDLAAQFESIALSRPIDEDAVEAAFWSFDTERKRSGAERDAFKGWMRRALRHRLGSTPADARPPGGTFEPVPGGVHIGAERVCDVCGVMTPVTRAEAHCPLPLCNRIRALEEASGRAVRRGDDLQLWIGSLSNRISELDNRTAGSAVIGSAGGENV